MEGFPTRREGVRRHPRSEWGAYPQSGMMVSVAFNFFKVIFLNFYFSRDQHFVHVLMSLLRCFVMMLCPKIISIYIFLGGQNIFLGFKIL